MTQGRKRGFTILCAGFAASVVLCAASAPALAQPSGGAAPAPATEQLDSISPKDLASPRRAMEALMNPSEVRTSKRANLCPGNDPICWADGVVRNGFVGNQCDYEGSSQGYESAYVGTTVADDAKWPATGDTYWGHVVVFYSPCTTNYLISYATPPPNTEFALDPGLKFNAGRTRCFTTFVDINVFTGQEAGRRTFDVTGSNVDEAICSGPPGNGAYGATLASQQMVGTNGCPISGCDPLDYTGSYMIWEVVFPLETSKKLNGIASTNHKLSGATSSSSGNLLFPETWVTVGQADMAVKGKRKGGKVRITGAVGPSSSARNAVVKTGEARRAQMRVTLLAKRGGRFKPAGSKNLLVSTVGTFVTTFKKPKGAAGCKVEASWNGNKVQKSVAC